MINKAFRVAPLSKVAYSLAFGALLLLLFIVNPANSAFQCTQCPENFYCTGGQKLACPAEKPVTGKLGATECKTCEEIDNALTPVTVNGACLSCYDSSKDSANITHVWKNKTCMTCDAADENYPAFVEGEGCVTCAQANGNDTEFFWDKTAKSCVACRASDNKTWDTTAASCGCKDGYYKEEISEGVAIKDANGNTLFNITANMIFSPTPIDKDHCATLNEDDAKYPEITSCMDYEGAIDRWAGAVEHCRNQNKRLPSHEEMVYLAQELYGDKSISTDNSQLGTNLVNTTLWNALGGTQIALWTNNLTDSVLATAVILGTDSYQANIQTVRASSEYDFKAFCIEDK